MALREDQVAQAVQFLKNPQVQASPLGKKVAFLEQKGLTQEEIEEAFSRSGKPLAGSSSAAAAAPAPVAPAPPLQQQPVYQQYSSIPPPLPPYPHHQQPAPGWNWKDVFIALVAAGGVGYAGFHFVKKFVGPAIQWPSASDLESDRKDIEDKYKTTSQSLNTVQEQTASLLSALEIQNSHVKEGLESMEALLKDLTRVDKERESEVKALKEDIESVKDLIPRMVEKTKEDQKLAIAELQGELKSLKSLLLNRGASTPGAAPLAPFPTTPSLQASGRPAVGYSAQPPAWQRPSTESPSPASNLPSRPSLPAWQLESKPAEKAPEKEKEKEKEKEAVENEQPQQAGGVEAGNPPE